MPIEVRHGEPDMAALAALAAVIGAGEQRAPEIPQMIIGGTPVGGGRGGGGGWARGRESYVSGLSRIRPGKPTMEEQLQYEGEKMQLQEKAEAEGWERKYSAKKRQDIAVTEKARQDLKANPAFDEREKMIGDRALIIKQLGIEKDVIPPDPDKEVFEPGKGPRDTWKHEVTDDIMGYDRNGNQVVRIKFADTPEGRDETHQRAMELEGAKAAAALDKEMRSARLKLLSERVKEIQGVGDEATEIDVPRYRGPGADRLLREAGYPIEEQGMQGEGTQIITPNRLLEASSAMQEMGTLIPRESDADLPGYVGVATSFLRKMKSESERGKDISRYDEAIREARIIMAQYMAGEIPDAGR